MREKKKFAERSRILSDTEVRKKVYLVYEGEKTEALYFEAVDALKTELGLNPIIELIPILRSYNERGWSNPKKILERIIRNLDETKSGKYSYESFFNCFLEFYDERHKLPGGKVQKQSIWNSLVFICTQECQKKLSDIMEDLETEGIKILEQLAEKEKIINVAKHISEILQIQELTYAEGFDKICLIVDRDPQSFSEEQYDQVVQICKERQIDFYVTNPCFEFWLLLHFPDHKNLDPVKIKENSKVSSRSRYLENELKKRCGSYQKYRYDAEDIVRRVDTAVINSTAYCVDINLLKNEIGSNLGTLIHELRT